MSETKVHVLPDDNLGGVLREFVEVDRKAKKGDFIVVYGDSHIYEDITAGKPYLVRNARDFVNYVIFYDDVGDERYWKIPREDSAIIEPTDIVHIDGQRYRLVDRKAKVGEKVMYYKDGKSDGVVTTCIGYNERFNDCIDVEPYLTKGDDEETCGFADGYYRVLEPITDHSTADMLASLAQKIVELERKIARLEERTESNARDIETWAQEVERLAGNQSVTLTFDSATIAKIMAKVVAEWR